MGWTGERAYSGDKINSVVTTFTIQGEMQTIHEGIKFLQKDGCSEAAKREKEEQGMSEYRHWPMVVSKGAWRSQGSVDI